MLLSLLGGRGRRKRERESPRLGRSWVGCSMMGRLVLDFSHVCKIRTSFAWVDLFYNISSIRL